MLIVLLNEHAMSLSRTLVPFSFGMDTAPSPRVRKRKRKQGGGLQQRLAKYGQEEAPVGTAFTLKNERLASRLASQWAWGHTSPQEVQSTSSAALADMESLGLATFPPFLSKFAALGGGGEHPNNMHKELLKIFESSCKLPESLLVQLPFKLKNYLQSFMLPHELFANLYLHFPTAWQKIFMPQGPEQLQTFWARFRHHPSMQGHEVLSVPGFDSCCIPCNFHGDAVPVVGRGKVWTKMLLVLSWTGCLAEGNSQETCNLIWAVPRQQTRHTQGIMRPQIHYKF